MFREIILTIFRSTRLCVTVCGMPLLPHRGSRGIALLFHDHGTRKGWGVSVTPRPLFTPRKELVPILQEAGCAPGPDWTGVENLAYTGIRTRTVQPVSIRYTDYATRPTRSDYEVGQIYFLHYSLKHRDN